MKVCPNCGTELPDKARACPECGSDETTGWSQEAHVSGLDLPDDSFNYDEFVKREFEGHKTLPHGLKWFWWAVAALLLSVFLWAGFRWLL